MCFFFRWSADTVFDFFFLGTLLLFSLSHRISLRRNASTPKLSMFAYGCFQGSCLTLLAPEGFHTQGKMFDSHESHVRQAKRRKKP